MSKKERCCLCGKIFKSDLEKNNPWPVDNDVSHHCCKECNENKVIPARLKLFYKFDPENP